MARNAVREQNNLEKKRKKEASEALAAEEDELIASDCFKPNGRGVLLMKDYDGKGTGIYEGYFNTGKKTHGRVVLFSHEIYDGEWENEKYHGQGDHEDV